MCRAWLVRRFPARESRWRIWSPEETAGRGGAVVAGEGVLGGEPGHVTSLGQQAPGDHRPDAEQGSQARAGGGDQGGDLAADVLDPGVQGTDAGEVVAGDMHPDTAHVIGRADQGEQRLEIGRAHV